MATTTPRLTPAEVRNSMVTLATSIDALAVTVGEHDDALATVRADIVRLDARCDSIGGTSTIERPRRHASAPRTVADPTGKAAVDDGAGWLTWLAKLTPARAAWIAPLHAAGVPLAEAKATYHDTVERYRAGERNVFDTPATTPAADTPATPAPAAAPAAANAAANPDVTLASAMAKLAAVAVGSKNEIAKGKVVIGGREYAVVVSTIA